MSKWRWQQFATAHKAIMLNEPLTFSRVMSPLVSRMLHAVSCIHYSLLYYLLVYYRILTLRLISRAAIAYQI